MTKIMPGYLLLCVLVGSAFAAFLVNRQQYHPNTVNRDLLRYGFSPHVEKVLATDFFVPSGAAGAGTVAYIRGELGASLDNGLNPVASSGVNVDKNRQFENR